MEFTDDWIFISIKELHFSNVLSSIIEREEGDSNSTFVSDEHFINADFPIDLTDDGIDISVNDEHSIKEEFLIKVTDEGIINFFNDLHLPNEFSHISVTEEGIEISVNEEQQ